MLGLVKEISGQKTIIPLTTDTGTGAPVGTLISQYKKVPMSGYLYCDGSTFDETAYPALYLYLGSNVLPDYRECVMVGAEQNTTDNITTHDVYTQGQFKDDQLQEHYHYLSRSNSGTPQPIFHQNNDEGSFHGALVTTTTGRNATPITTTFSIAGARSGTTTHGKQKAVFVYIKATSGLAENQQENVLNDVKDSLGRINILSNQVYFTALNTDITVNINEDIGDGTVLHLILGTRINSTSDDVRLCDCSVFVSENQTCYIYTFYEARNNTQVKGLIRPYIAGSKQLVLNFWDGTLYPQDDYVVHAVIKG